MQFFGWTFVQIIYHCAKLQTANNNQWSVFYNVFSSEWESLPVEINEDEVIENYFDSLDPEDDRETIESFITKLQALLEEGE